MRLGAGFVQQNDKLEKLRLVGSTSPAGHSTKPPFFLLSENTKSQLGPDKDPTDQKIKIGNVCTE